MIDNNSSITDEFSIINKKIAIVNPWENKFTDLYIKYFKRNNEVWAGNLQKKNNINEILNWADIVWSQWCNEWLAAISKKKLDATLVTHIHSYEILVPQLMKNVCWNRVDGIMFVADHIKENANHLWPNQIKNIPQKTIYNCVDLNEYPLRKTPKEKNIGYVGYINHKKGVGLLLQCIKSAVKYDPEFKLHIAGSFQEIRFEVYMLHLIEQMGLKENIIFHGWVKNVPEWLKTINYIVSTSPWEGCPMNLIEAMACGVKPLIHNWQGAKTLFPEKFIFNTVDEFVSLIMDPEFNSQEYRNIVDKDFNAIHNISKIESFLANCLKKTETKKTSANARKNDIVSCEKESSFNQNIIKVSPLIENKEINFFQPLERTIELSSNRKKFTVDFCRGKRVLHIGCVDAGIMNTRIKGNGLLHYQINKVATKLIGADIEENGLKYLAGEGFEVYNLNIETDLTLLKKLTQQVDIIVMPEVIEHLNNVGKALENIKSCEFKGDILISTPNAFSFRAYKMLAKCIEMVHPDHNYYFSPVTLKTLFKKHGFNMQRLIMYYWKTDDLIGKEIQKIVVGCPYYAEGMIAVVKDCCTKNMTV